MEMRFKLFLINMIKIKMEKFAMMNFRDFLPPWEVELTKMLTQYLIFQDNLLKLLSKDYNKNLKKEEFIL